jgi:hypothetical protein
MNTNNISTEEVTMQTLITRPTIADVTNLNDMVAYLCLEIKSAKDKQEALFKKALVTQCFYKRTELLAMIDNLNVQETDLTKHMHSVHYQALEVMGDDDFVVALLAA